jgi:hypothetical protein
MPSFYQSAYNPWYTPFGAMGYSNFYSPSPWIGGGMNMGYFPGGGHGAMGKPNLYISGPAGAQISVQIKLARESTLLAAVPIYGANGWTGTLQKNGTIQSQDVTYPYFFYDLRMDETSLQSEAGFCVSQDKLIQKLAEVLQEKGFRPNEVRDFQEYWSVKMPPSEKYCVFPQENDEMDTLAKLQISPSPDKVTRIGFMIVVAEGIVQSSRKFTQVPTKPWKVGQQSPSKSSSSLEIREWGVGFVESTQAIRQKYSID